MNDFLKTISPFVAQASAFFVSHILAAVGIVVFGWLAISLAARTIRAGGKEARIKPALIDLAVAGLRGIGLLVMLSSTLQVLGLDSIALAVGGSISLIALGIATAANGNLGDIIAGVFLASDPDFGTGFAITTNTITGVIEHVDLRKTRIRAADGRLHIMPNKLVEGNTWVVEARPSPTNAPPLFRGLPQIPLPHRNPQPAQPTQPTQPHQPPRPPMPPG
jgi:small-conductance mechanosensitive channel